MIRSGEQGAILRDGDEWCYGEKEWAPVPKHWVGERAINNTNRYRRRVAPDVAEAPQSRPAETRASSRQYVIDYDRETREWNELADAELARRATIPSEVARLRAENATLRSGAELLSAEATTLRSEVERLRLTEEERESVQRAAAFLTKLAERHGGGE